MQRMLASDVALRRRPTAVSTVQAVVQAAKQPHQQQLLIHSGVIEGLLYLIVPQCASTNEDIVSILATALEWPESGCDPTSPRMHRWCQTIAESRDKLAALEGQSSGHCYPPASQPASCNLVHGTCPRADCLVVNLVLGSHIRSALVTPPGFKADSQWNDPFFPSSSHLDSTVRIMRLLQTHIYSKQRMPATRLVLQRQWKVGAATTAMGVEAPLWFDAVLAALVARQAERDAELDDSDYEFDDEMDEDEMDEMGEDEMDEDADEMDAENAEDDEPFGPMRPRPT